MARRKPAINGEKRNTKEADDGVMANDGEKQWPAKWRDNQWSNGVLRKKSKASNV